VKIKGRHLRCRAKADYGINEYDAHPHQCVLTNGHAGEHVFSQCMEHRGSKRLQTS
jgi:hypothetical protein